ncbi:MAG: adenosylcobinamide amidohydrolase [Halobacteriales archaeon]
MFEHRRRDGVLQLRRPGTRWLSTGYDGGRERADAAYVCTVPKGFRRTDLDAYCDERLAAAGFDEEGPVLLTGVDVGGARGARSGAVEAVATAGVSNPAALPVGDHIASAAAERSGASGAVDGTQGRPDDDGEPPPGTVNVVVGTTRDLAPGALTNLVAVAAEAKAATLLATTGFPGTTSDAVLVADDPSGSSARFSGSATEVGAAARACVRGAVDASLRARYDDESPPTSVADAEHGVVTDRRAEVFEPGD